MTQTKLRKEQLATLNVQTPYVINVAGGTIISVPASSTYYTWLGAVTLFNAFGGTIFPAAGTFLNMYIRLSGTQPSTGSLVVTLMKNNVATALVVTFPANTPASTTGTDLVNTVTWAAGDIFTWRLVNNATAVSGTVSSFAINFQKGL